VIGRSNSQGIINFQEDLTFASELTLRSPLGNGTINSNGYDLTAHNQVNLNAKEEINVNNITVTGNGNLNLVSNEINFEGGANSITGNGTLTIQPYGVNQDINLGGIDSNNPNILELDSRDISAFNQSFKSVVIGRSNSEGIINFQEDLTFASELTLRSPLGNGTINSNGYDLTAHNQVNLNAKEEINVNNITVTGNGNLNLVSNEINVNNNLNLEGVGNLTLVGNEINLQGGENSVTGNGKVTIQSINPDQTITLNGTEDLGNESLDFTQSDFAALSNNFTRLIMGKENVNGFIQLANDLTLNRGVTFNQRLEGMNEGGQSLTINVNDQDVMFKSSVGAYIPLNHLIVSSNGTIILNQDVSTSGNLGQSYQGNLILLGDLTLTGDELNFGGNISGNGNVTFKPYDVSRNILIGGNNNTPENLDFTQEEINALQDGFSSLTFGSNNHNGNISLAGDIIVKDPVRILSGNGIIQSQGYDLTGDTNVTLQSNNQIILNNSVISSPNSNLTMELTGVI
jgi:hypothetical protein